MKTLKARTLAVALASALSMGVASQAAAAPAFTIDLSAVLGGAPQLYTGDFFSGTSTELLTTVGNTHTGSGWMQLSGLSSGAVTQVPFGTNAFSPFNMYVTFDLEDVLTSGVMNAPGSTYNLTKLDFVLWADADKATTFTNANAATNTAATVANNANDVILGFGSLIAGTAGLSDLGGAFLNSINVFGVCTGAGTAAIGATAVASPLCASDMGKKFFVQPDPFYELAFTEFNNTAQGYTVNGNLLSINSASGGVDFNKVPEPGLLSLMGIGLLAGFMAKRKASKAA